MTLQSRPSKTILFCQAGVWLAVLLFCASIFLAGNSWAAKADPKAESPAVEEPLEPEDPDDLEKEEVGKGRANDAKPADGVPAGFTDPDPFRRGEFLFHAGKDAEARIQFQKYLNDGLDTKNIPEALFRLAEIEHRGKYYVTALRYLSQLLDRFPNASRFHQALFMMGECHFELDRLEPARKIFESESRNNPDPAMRIKALLYIARLDEKGLDYVQAVGRLREVFLAGQDDKVRQEAVRVAKRIIDEKLPRGELAAIAGQYKGGFPADLALWRLIGLSRIERDNAGYQSALNQFVASFATHPSRPQAEKFLAQAQTGASNSIKIGALLPLTGRQALTGNQVQQGIQLAFNQLAPADRSRVELVVRDSGAAGSIMDAAEALAADPNVVAVLGPVLSSTVKNLMPMAKNYQLPMFTPTASTPGLAAMSPYVFRNALTREIQARFLARYAVNELGLKRFVVLYPDESFGDELQGIFAEEARALGAEVVARVSYDRKQTDFKPQILDIGGISDNDLKKLTLQKLAQESEKQKNPQGKPPFSRPVIEKGVWNEKDVEGLKVTLELSYDAIFMPGFYDKVGLIIPQLIFYNIDRVTLLGTNGWNHPDLLKAAGNFLNNRGVFVEGFFGESGEERVKNFIRDFKAAFGEEPTALSAQAYDAAKILLDLILKGANSRADVHSRLFLVRDFPGVTGLTTILPDGESEKRLFPLKIRKNKIVPAD